MARADMSSAIALGPTRCRTSSITLPAPANLRAVAGNGTTTLTWSPSAGTAGYILQSSGASGGPYTTIGSAGGTSIAVPSTNGARAYYVVRAVNGNNISPESNVASALTLFASDLTWTNVTNGWGPPERNTSNGELAAGDGKTITLNGVTYAKGIGAHAASSITFSPGASCSTFTADIGIDDESRPGGSVVYAVYGDGAKLFQSGLVTGTSAREAVSVPIAGVSSIMLTVADGGDGNNSDHADWALAMLVCQ
jgi:alpha-galactosidase